MENLEMISFQIISCVGTAKSSYIEAARKAQEYEFDKAEELIKEGDAIYIKGHEAHASLIQQEARGGVCCGKYVVDACRGSIDGS